MKKEYIITLIGGIIGAAAGWLYWYYIGCMSGTCAITSRPLNSTIYGGIMGALVMNAAAPMILRKTITKQSTEKNDTDA